MPNALTRWWERRSSIATPSPDLLALFNAGPTPAGVTVSPQTALSVPAVFACVSVLSQDVARCPIKLRQKTGPDTYVDALDHPLYEILHDLANPEQTAYQAKYALQWQLLLYGRAYAEIVRVEGRVVALWPLLSEFMQTDRAPSGQKRWTYRVGAKTFVWVFDPSQPPILELTHESPILRCKDTIATALALQNYTGRFFANGAQPTGVLTSPAKLTPEQQQALREQWQARYTGTANAHRTAILSGGLDYKNLSMDHDSAQMTETLRALNEQIAGMFRVPPWKIGDLSKANYSNMETGELAYITDSLDPLFENWEEALRRDLLTTRQYGQYTVSFDRQALVRNDVRSLNASLQSGIQNGYLSQNDARKALGLNPIPDGDTYMVNTALQPVGAPKEAPVV